ncbi:hypothetical protein V8G54_023484 [Vigna mungo]|uniref:Uncharacterized protein n=1 Tax=Vigna mungo TaxID=3915 RepID=A0AAQ3N3Q1_VIGMU
MKTGKPYAISKILLGLGGLCYYGLIADRSDMVTNWMERTEQLRCKKAPHGCPVPTTVEMGKALEREKVKMKSMRMVVMVVVIVALIGIEKEGPLRMAEGICDSPLKNPPKKSCAVSWCTPACINQHRWTIKY